MGYNTAEGDSADKKVYFTGEPVSLTPSYDGVVSEFTISPELPPGLKIDVETGVITGVPTTVTPEKEYTITAANDMGKCEKALIMEIKRGPPKNLAYLDVKDVYAKLRPLTINPTYEGDNVEFTISPSLPAGVSIDPASGIISGTPTEIKPRTTYKVVAKNETGSCDAELAFSVEVSPPTDLDYERILPVYYMNEDVGDLEPSVEGCIDEFSIEPALPTGLTFDNKTGIITGKPTVETPVTDYTVTASNEGGGTSTVVTFATQPLAPSDLKYFPKDEYMIDEDVNIEPESENCIACQYTISPSLPDGLEIDADTGDITGTPTAATDKNEYTVTAKNSNGETTAKLEFAIVPGGPNHVDQKFALWIDECTDIDELLAGEPDKAKAYGNWMVWMVHRAYLDDPTLTEFNFSNLKMPLPNHEYRVAPKLMEALADHNTHIEIFLLPNSNLRRAQGPAFADALSKNTHLKTVDVSSNDLDPVSLKAMAIGIKDNQNSNIEKLIFQNCGGQTNYGNQVEEALFEMMKVSKKISKLGCQLNNPGYRDLVNRATIRNADAARRARRGAPLASVKAVTKRALKKIMVEDAPEGASFDFFPTEDDKLLKAREFLAGQKAMPNSTLLQNHMKKVGCSLKFSEVGPFLKDVQTRLLNASKGVEITCFGPTGGAGDEERGVLNSFEVANRDWKIEITTKAGKKYSFEMKGDLEIKLCDDFAEWLQ